MAERIILHAEDGMVLTNGTDYGRIIYLANGVDPATFYQITQEEYEAIMAAEDMEDEMSLDQADGDVVSEQDNEADGDTTQEAE